MLLLESDWQFQILNQQGKKYKNLPLNARLPFLWGGGGSGYETINIPQTLTFLSPRT